MCIFLILIHMSAELLTTRVITDLHRLGFVVRENRSLACTKQASPQFKTCVYHAVRLNRNKLADTRGTELVVRLSRVHTKLCAKPSCAPCKELGKVRDAHVEVHELLNKRHGEGQNFISQHIGAWHVGESCELVAIVQRQERGGRLDEMLSAWLFDCVAPLTLISSRTVGTMPFLLDLQCILHQLLTALDLLQQTLAVVHVDLHTQNILVRSRPPAQRCSPSSSERRPHVVISDFEHSFIWHRNRQCRGPCSPVTENEIRPPEEDAEDHRILRERPVFSTPWSWDAWFVADMMVQWSTLAGMRPTLASQLDDCSSVEIQWTKSSRGMDRRRGGFASGGRRLYSASTHACASARYKNATLKLQSALGDHATFAAYLAEQTARRTSQLFGHAFLSGYEQLGWRGVELVRRLAAWDPGERLSANAALKSEYFATLDSRCPSASQASTLGTAADPPSSVDSPRISPVKNPRAP